MGDVAGQRAALDRSLKWNHLLDVLAEHHAQKAAAEDVVEAVTAYVVSIHNIRITIPDEH